MALRVPQKLHYNRGNRLQTQPTAEPVTLSEIKTHLRIEDDADNGYLAELIQEATQEIEDTTGLALITQTWQLTIDRWPHAREQWWDGEREAHVNVIHSEGRYASITLPRYPLQSVDAVTVYAEDGTSTAVTIGNVFDIDTQRLRGRMTLKRGATWPVALRANNAIEIVYTSGYGTDPNTVPAAIKRAIRQMAAYMYEHRGDGCEPKDAYSASGAMNILNRYRDVEV